MKNRKYIEISAQNMNMKTSAMYLPIKSQSWYHIEMNRFPQLI